MSSLKDSVAGIIILGVFSSLIASYIWEHRSANNSTRESPGDSAGTGDAGSANSPQNAPRSPQDHDSSKPLVPTEPARPFSSETSSERSKEKLQAPSSKLDQAAAGPTSETTPTPSRDAVETPRTDETSAIPLPSLPGPEEFRNLFPAAADGFKGLRFGKPVAKTDKGRKVWTSSVVLRDAKGCEVSEKPGVLECYLGTHDKPVIDQQFASLCRSVRYVWPLVSVSKSPPVDQVAAYQAPNGPQIVFWTEPYGSEGSYALFVRMISKK